MKYFIEIYDLKSPVEILRSFKMKFANMAEATKWAVVMKTEKEGFRIEEIGSELDIEENEIELSASFDEVDKRLLLEKAGNYLHICLFEKAKGAKKESVIHFSATRTQTKKIINFLNSK